MAAHLRLIPANIISTTLTHKCSLFLPQCSLGALLCSLSTPSNAALAPFSSLTQHTNPKIGVYMVHMYILSLASTCPHLLRVVPPSNTFRFTQLGPRVWFAHHWEKLQVLKIWKEACIERDQIEKTAAESPWYNRITPNVEKAKPFQPLASQEGLINS